MIDAAIGRLKKPRLAFTTLQQNAEKFCVLLGFLDFREALHSARTEGRRIANLSYPAKFMPRPGIRFQVMDALTNAAAIP